MPEKGRAFHIESVYTAGWELLTAQCLLYPASYHQVSTIITH